MTWKFLRHDSRRDEEVGERFEGSAMEVLAFAAEHFPAYVDAQLLVVSVGPAERVEAADELRVRLIEKRRDGRGWNLIENQHDHGGWHESARSAADYALCRAHDGYVLVICIRNTKGRFTQIIMHDARDEKSQAGHGLRGAGVHK